jgi:fibronectin-binding autotransporter adhesin
MANRFAVASGNFNDTATWSTTAAGSPGASVPVAGDNAIANNRTVTITANANCDNVTNTTIYGGTAGGSFVLQNGVTLAATTISASAVSVVQFSQASPASATLTISETIPNLSAAVVTNSNTGTLNINASVFKNNQSGTSAHGISNSGGGIVNFTGLLSQTGGASASVIHNSLGGTINVNGTNVGRAITNGSTGTIVWNGELTALNDSPAITSTTAGSTVRASGNFIFSANGTVPIYAQRFILGTTPTAAKTQYALNGTGTYVNMFTADNTGLAPAVTDVRAGVVYGSATGALAVPPANSVAFGVAVDNTTGTAVLTLANVQSALTAQGLTTARAGALDNLDTTVSSRLAPSGTLATVTTLTTAPSVPSASAIASQVRSELSPELTKVSALNTARLSQCTTTEILGNLLAQANS